MITNVVTFVVKVWHQSVLPVRFRGDYSELSELHDTRRVSDSSAQRQAAHSEPRISRPDRRQSMVPTRSDRVARGQPGAAGEPLYL